MPDGSAESASIQRKIGLVVAVMRARLTVISFGLAVVAAIFLLAWPVYSGFNGERPTHATLIQINGAWVVFPVLFPVLVAALPVVGRRHWLRIAAAIVMGAFVFISGMSIGLLYLPAGILMLLAACVEDSAKLRDLR